MSGLFWGVQLFCDNHIEPYCDFWFYFDKSYIFITNPLLFCYKHNLWIMWLVVAMFSKFSERCSDYSRGHICHYSVVTFQWNQLSLGQCGKSTHLDMSEICVGSFFWLSHEDYFIWIMTIIHPQKCDHTLTI